MDAMRMNAMRMTLSDHVRSRFMASPQARVALAISALYVVSTALLRPTIIHVVAGAIKMLSVVYTVNCMVSGGCGLMGWTNVVGLAMFWVADVMVLLNDGAGGSADPLKRKRRRHGDAVIIRTGLRASA